MDFKAHFTPFKVFSTQDILKWEQDFDSRRLIEWQQKGYIKRIINRWYLFADIVLNENLLFLVSNRIYSPSYVSFESAMSYYGFIPEGVYTVTSATSLKTQVFETGIGKFSYRHLKPRLIFGYKLLEINGQRYKIAEPEKLILDYLYLNSALQAADDFEGLRLNHHELLMQLDEHKLMKYLALFQNKSLEKRVCTFQNTLRHA